MNRRGLVSVLLVGLIPGAGCVESDSQPDQVPVWIDNQTGSVLTGDVVLTEAGEAVPVLERTFDLEPNEEAPFYAEGITEWGKYTVVIRLEDTRAESAISGGGLREVDVTIRSAERIQINRIST